MAKMFCYSVDFFFIKELYTVLSLDANAEVLSPQSDI